MLSRLDRASSREKSAGRPAELEPAVAFARVLRHTRAHGHAIDSELGPPRTAISSTECLTVNSSGSRPSTVLFSIVITCLWAANTCADERLWLDGTINGKPVRVVFDTGSSQCGLLPDTAERLGLKSKPPTSAVRPGEGGLIGMTAELYLPQWKVSSTITFETLEFPAYLGKVDLEGLYGWNQIRSNICAIDAEALTVKLLDRVPEEATAWTKFIVVERAPTLSLALPGQLWTIAVDTGAPDGVALVSQKWREWKAANTNAPLTLWAAYSPPSGAAVCEVSWAKELSLGPLTLSGVPVRQANLIESAHGQPIVGLAALKRLDFIIDGKRGVAYLRPKRTPPPPYPHNRLGAEFMPRHWQADDLVAQVVDGSPAQVAGIRNGDILLKVGDRDVTNWRKAGRGPPERSCELPAGTKLDLTLKRGEETLKVSVVLRDILLP